MKRFCQFFMMTMLLASSQRLLAEEKLYPVETAVEIVGVVAEGKGYDANDRRENYFYLKLERPISVAGDKIDRQRDGVAKIQMVFLADMDGRQYYRKRVVIKGKLFHGHTAHHHTGILVQIESSADIRLLQNR